MASEGLSVLFNDGKEDAWLERVLDPRCSTEKSVRLFTPRWEIIQTLLMLSMFSL